MRNLIIVEVGEWLQSNEKGRELLTFWDKYLL